MPEPNKSQTDGPQPSLKPTTPSTLLVSAMAAVALMLMLATRYYEYFPAMSWFTPILLIAVAFLLGFLSWHVKARIDRKPGHDPVEPLMFARYAALAKACAIGGAVIGGGYAGLLIYTAAQRRLTAASEDLPVVALGLGACLLLIAAALWLEWSCRVPPKKDDSEDDNPSDGQNS